VFFVVATAYASEQESVALQKGSLGKAPAFSYLDASGKTVALSTGKHKLTALHFWATWCVPCADELPQIDDEAGIYGADLQVLPIAIDGSNIAKVKKFYATYKIIHLPVMLDPTAKTPKTAGLKGLPGTLFINAKGEVIARADGPLDWQREDVAEFLKSALK
jgi:thiol-disulfide isomerase/thioredoxin